MPVAAKKAFGEIFLIKAYLDNIWRNYGQYRIYNTSLDNLWVHSLLNINMKIQMTPFKEHSKHLNTAEVISSGPGG